MIGDQIANSAPKILIVDDVASERLLLASLLSRHGYEVESCDSGEAALDRLDGGGVSLVLLDLYMQGIDGLTVCKEIRKSRSREELPVVLVTAEESGELVAGGIRAGANDYICKPFDRQVLLARIENQVALLQARQDLKLAQSRLRIDMVGVLCSGIAHNMNNLFSALLGSVQLGRRDEGQSKRLTFCFDTIERAIKSGTELTTKLGFFQRVLPYADSSSELLAVAGDVRKRLASEIPTATQIDLNKIDPTVRVACTEEELGEVLSEIFQNALEASAGREPAIIELSHGAIGTSGAHLTIALRDNGCGMDQETSSRVCEPFFSTKTLDERHGVSVSGRGLGMWKVYWIVHARAGTVNFKSVPDKGTEVFITLPLGAK